jgi:hypothetical protein
MLKKITLFILLFCGTLSAQKSYFEWRTYDLPWGSNTQPLHDYISQALIPALNAQGVKNIGAFEPMAEQYPNKLHLLIAYDGMAHYEQVQEALHKDISFQKAKAVYDAVPADAAPYRRFSTSFYLGFDNFPHLVLPKDGDVVFELRTYESYSENAAERKRKMFNVHEFDIFNDAGLHSIFFGQQVSGPDMPSLRYITSHASMEARDKAWDAFRVHPDWKRVSKLKEYEDSVSDIVLDFIKRLPYSQL